MTPTCCGDPYRPVFPANVLPPCLAAAPYACECGCIWPSDPFDARPCADCREPRPPIRRC